MLDELIKALDAAQAELAQAEISLLKSTTAAEEARIGASRLEAAVAALRGESPAATTKSPEDFHAPTLDMTPEEFEAHRRRRARAREQENQANNPYASLKCTGCGSVGSMSPTIITAPSGMPVHMLTCRCGNQMMK